MKNYLKLSLTLFLYITSQHAFCQELFNNKNAISMGKAFTGLNSANVYSVFNNQANLAYIDKMTIGVAASNNFFIKELSESSLAAAIPTKFGSFGLGLNYFGFNLFGQFTTGIAYAMPLGEKFAGGIKISFLHQQLAAYYGNANAVYGEIGFTAKITERLKMGAHVFNPTRAKLNSETTTAIPTYESIGLSYLFSDRFELNAEQVSDFDFNYFKFGGNFKINDFLVLRSGLLTNPSIACFGAGFFVKNINFNFAFNYNSSSLSSTNALSSSVDIVYSF
jgi:hypothetical protein